MGEETIHVQLLHRIAQQDRNALEQFYDQSAGLLFSIATRILGDSHEAEEVIQDVFVQLWNKAGEFDRSLGSPMCWVVGMTRNRSIDRLRSRQRRSRLATDFANEFEVVDGASAKVELADAELEAVRTAVCNLPLEQRQALQMAFFGGLTHQEIAEALNEPLGTVKARIRRGMLKLRDTLQAFV
jgi:RNA polymerase sigma-70 factor (ECF subfamily)